MKPTFLSGLFAASAAVAGLISSASPAAAFTWNSTWTQPQIYSKAQTGFNDSPFQNFVQSERISIPNSGQFQLDPSKLKLKYDHDVSVYFINEGAGYRNQLAYQASGAQSGSGLVFKDVSSSESILSDSNGPLKKGDGVKLGNFLAGTQLDFWLRADGLNRGSNANIFGTQTAFNADGLQHAVAYAFDKYLMVGFEDLYGGLNASGGKNEHSDRDFNDAVFVIDVGEANVKHMTSVPEPSMTLAFLGLSAASALGLRRRRQAEAASQE
ncbi:MAG TPA: DUF4114 domain-containing protein [Trichocoleus sp.]|jgi:hypothetical protein